MPHTSPGNLKQCGVEGEMWVVIVVVGLVGVLAVVLSACAMASRADEINNLNPDDEAAAWAAVHHGDSK